MRCAVDIGATRTMLALVEADAPQVIAWERPMTDSLFKGELPPVQALAEALRAFVTSHGVTLSDLSGIGIGVPGVADRRQGLVVSCPNLPILDGLLLGPLLSQELGVPVYVDNNTNLICLGEHTAGLGQGIHNLAVIFVGSGVGCGLIINDELYEGSDGAAGEFGHMIVVPNGLQCSCGAHGCLEMYCSGKALARVASQIFMPRDLYAMDTRFGGAQLLIEHARIGDRSCIRALDEAFTYLGIGLTSLVNLLNPRMVILGGGIIMAWPQGVDRAREVVMSEALPAVRRNLHIELSQLQNFAGVLGGAALVSAQGKIGRHHS